MEKQEFLDSLRRALHGKVPPGQVVENLQYYEEYINTEIRKGTAEAEVMSKLGDPRLIARTIVEANGGTSGSGWYEKQEDGTDETWYESTEEEYQPYSQPGERRLRMLLKVPGWAWGLLVLLIVLLVLSAVFSLLAAVLPFLLPILLVLLAVKAFRDWIH